MDWNFQQAGGRQDRGDTLPVHKAVVSAAIGLHARPAAEFVRAVTATGLPVSIRKAGCQGVDARSLLEVMTADFPFGCEVELSVPGKSPRWRCSSAKSRGCPDVLGSAARGAGGCLGPSPAWFAGATTSRHESRVDGRTTKDAGPLPEGGAQRLSFHA